MPQDITSGPGVYLCHFDQKYHHAGHYTGYSADIARRIAQHRRGEGARLMEVIRDAGIDFVVAQVWPDGTRELERRLKRRHGASQYCPVCRGEIEIPRPPDRRLAYLPGKRRPMPTGLLSVYFPG